MYLHLATSSSKDLTNITHSFYLSWRTFPILTPLILLKVFVSTSKPRCVPRCIWTWKRLMPIIEERRMGRFRDRRPSSSRGEVFFIWLDRIGRPDCAANCTSPAHYLELSSSLSWESAWSPCLLLHTWLLKTKHNKVENISATKQTFVNLSLCWLPNEKTKTVS